MDDKRRDLVYGGLCDEIREGGGLQGLLWRRMPAGVTGNLCGFYTL